MKASMGEHDRQSFAFGPFRLDPGARTLEKDGVPVPLLPKSFDALLVLVRNSGRLLDKEFLMAEIWPDTHVEENNLARAISDIRKALDEGPKDQRYVVTVARRGYRFAASVETVEDVASLRSAAADASATAAAESASEPSPAVYGTTGVPELERATSGRLGPSWLAYGAAATALVGLLGVGRAYWARPGAVLGAKDVVLLADFTNQTGEPVFDGTLREALAVQLERSPFLKVMDDAQVRQSLRLMGRAPDERITNEVARQVCVREREKATIAGSIAKLGGSYTLLLKATSCDAEQTLARLQVTATDPSHVLTALASAATGLRNELGESLTSIQQLERHAVTEVTTPSLDAFQVYARGADLYRRGLSLEAVPFFRRAIEIDPAFAMALQLLGNAYEAHGELALAAEYSARAFALVDGVSERERLAITAVYHMRVTGDTSRAAEALQLFVQTFPRSPTPRAYRASFYAAVGAFERAARDYEELLQLDPRSWIGYISLIGTYAQLGRFDEVQRVWHGARALKLDSPGVHHILLGVALIQDDAAAAATELKTLEGTETDHITLDVQALDAIARGQRQRAATLLAQAATFAAGKSLHGLADSLKEASAADPYGDCQRDDGVTGALRACADIEVEMRAAERRLKERPSDTLLAAVHAPMRQAQIALRQDKPAQAIALLAAAMQFERRYPEVIYLRGLAFLKTKQYGQARMELQKIVEHPGATWGARYPLAILGMARAASRSGDIAAARKYYTNFLNLWKDADPDLSPLLEAKAEFAALPKS